MIRRSGPVSSPEIGAFSDSFGLGDDVGAFEHSFLGSDFDSGGGGGGAPSGSQRWRSQARTNQAVREELKTLSARIDRVISVLFELERRRQAQDGRALRAADAGFFDLDEPPAAEYRVRFAMRTASGAQPIREIILRRDQICEMAAGFGMGHPEGGQDRTLWVQGERGIEAKISNLEGGPIDPHLPAELAAIALRTCARARQVAQLITLDVGPFEVRREFRAATQAMVPTHSPLFFEGWHWANQDAFHALPAVEDFDSAPLGTPLDRLRLRFRASSGACLAIWPSDLKRLIPVPTYDVPVGRTARRVDTVSRLGALERTAGRHYRYTLAFDTRSVSLPEARGEGCMREIARLAAHYGISGRRTEHTSVVGRTRWAGAPLVGPEGGGRYMLGVDCGLAVAELTAQLPP